MSVRWVAKIERLVKKERLWESPDFSPISISHPKHFLIYSPVPWPQGNLERMLSVVLQLRGHVVDEVYCGGNLPACGMEHWDIQRPACEECVKDAISWFHLWKLHPSSTEDYREEDFDVTAANFLEKIDFSAYADLNYRRLFRLTYNGLPLGKRIYEQTYWYFSGPFADKQAIQEYMEKVAYSYIITSLIATKIFNQKRYDAVILCNGKTIECGPVLDVACQQNIHVVTWEEIFVFSHNTSVTDRDLTAVWTVVKDIPLTKRERRKIEQYIDQRARSRISEDQYYRKPILDPKKIRNLLNISEDSFTIVLFTSFLGDTISIGMNTVFDSTLDWMTFCIQYAINNPEIDLIIRTHPAERFKGPMTGVTGTTVDYIDEHFKELPPNVTILPPESEISSYALIEVADIPVAYSSSFIVEAPVLGRSCVVTGKVLFVDQSLMVEVRSKNELTALFDRRQPLPRLSEQQKELALKNVYMYFFRFFTKLDFYNPKKYSYHIRSLKMLKPGGHTFWDNLCDSIIHNYALLDLSQKDRNVIDLNTLSIGSNDIS